jgi:serine/threonine protein kinase
MIGRQLSHFRILDRIGEGGMGVVYRAEDEKLQRVVALKVLPPERLADEERRLRFLREARTAAAVTHPNIAVIHEIDESDGVVFIAMELIEGKTLRAVIGGKPLALREALRLGVEIAGGLSAAHHARVIHRDLKPDNVLVTHDGRVKILDFGLAKLLEERHDPAPGEESKLATISDEMTQAGRVLGTASYMSPEQARGLPVDARSDLFSFGIVLYEMVTGRPPFRGSTSMDTLTAILREHPVPAVQLNPEVPAELERILSKCLEKEPGERYQDGRDLVVDLRKVKRDTESQPLRRAEITTTGAAGGDLRRPGWTRRLMWPAAALVVIGVLFVAVWRLLPRQEAKRELIQRQITANTPDNPVNSSDISPAGRHIVYGDRTGFYVRQIDSGETQPLDLPEGFEVLDVSWSPDPATLLLVARGSQDKSHAFWTFFLLDRTPRKVVDVVSRVTMGGASPRGQLLLHDNRIASPDWAAFSLTGTVCLRSAALPRSPVTTPQSVESRAPLSENALAQPLWLTQETIADLHR